MSQLALALLEGPLQPWESIRSLHFQQVTIYVARRSFGVIYWFQQRIVEAKCGALAFGLVAQDLINHKVPTIQPNRSLITLAIQLRTKQMTLH
jgi:hypothetical protein